MNVEKQAKRDILVNEIMIMQACNHQAIVNYRDAFLVRGPPSTLWVAMDFVPGGTLAEVIAVEQSLTEPVIACVAHSVCLRFTQQPNTHNVISSPCPHLPSLRRCFRRSTTCTARRSSIATSRATTC